MHVSSHSTNVEKRMFWNLFIKISVDSVKNFPMDTSCTHAWIQSFTQPRIKLSYKCSAWTVALPLPRWLGCIFPLQAVLNLTRLPTDPPTTHCFYYVSSLHVWSSRETTSKVRAEKVTPIPVTHSTSPWVRVNPLRATNVQSSLKLGN